MQWPIRFILLFFIVCAQSYSALSASIWSSTSMAESFMKSFTNTLSQANVLSGDQMDDIISIGKTLMGAVEKSGGKKNKLQALNMAFASSVAEIAFADMTGLPVDVKSNSILNALREAFLQTTEFVDNYLIQEIGGLINMFAEATANEAAASSAASASAGTAASAGGYGGQVGYGAGAGAGAAATAARAGGYGGYGRSAGAGAAAAAGAGAGAGGAGGYGGYGRGAGAGTATAAGSGVGTGGARGYGGQGGYGAGAGTFAGAGVGMGSTVVSTTSRLSSAEASSRISAAASTLVSGGYLNTAALPSVISDLFAQVSASSPGVSYTEVLTQVLLEIVASLIHILSSSIVGQVDFSSVGSSAATVGQSMQVVMG